MPDLQDQSWQSERFQEWLDFNACGNFNQAVDKKSTLANDWVNLMQICTQMKFYSNSTVEKMTHLVKSKWIYSSVKHADPEPSLPEEL